MFIFVVLTTKFLWIYQRILYHLLLYINSILLVSTINIIILNSLDASYVELR